MTGLFSLALLTLQKQITYIIFHTDWDLMVVPFSEPAEKSCRKKEKFNKKLRRGRVQVIECGFGLWKHEFPVLLNGMHLQKTSPLTILAALMMTLPNIHCITLTDS